ncbi:MAG: ABC transporter permease, partial [Bacteroidota bacterium]
MRQLFEITVSSFLMALQELWKNKLRTFLSLFGVTIGVFCIISVLATVNSLETNIQSTIQKLGSNTIYISKWEWGAGGGPDFPYWKYAKRPHANVSEMAQVKSRTTSAQYTAFFISTGITAEYAGNVLSNVIGYGITDEYLQIQPLDVAFGRQLTGLEFTNGKASAIIGFEIAENIFGNPPLAVGKQISVKGRNVIITGVIKKQGSQLIGGWQFDKTVVMPYGFARTLVDERRSEPLLMVKGTAGITSKVLKDEL